MASKIAVIGAVNGKFTAVFSKLAALQSKQSFAFAIVAGDLFADPTTQTEQDDDEVKKLIAGSIEIPVQTYFALGHHDLPQIAEQKLNDNLGELCTNLTALGRRGSVKTSQGFRIVAIGGRHVVGQPDQTAPFQAMYTDEDAKATKGFHDTDILVTSDWPLGVHMGSKIKRPPHSGNEVQSIAEVCATLKPRYHFSTSREFYEREPFFHADDDARATTRFLGLAPFNNPAKEKWIYAFTLEPAAPPPTVLPPGTTASPLTQVSKKRKLDSQQDGHNTFRFSTNNGHRHHEDGPRRKRRDRPAPTPRDCFFCLSNPSCETHMISSLGEEVYLTMAKGPLPTKATFPALNTPGHVLIIPYQHAPTVSSIDPEEVRQKVMAEMQKYRNALHTMVSDKSSDSDGRSQLGAVTFEISRAAGVHHHWQFLPVPADMIQRGLVEAAFDVEAESSNYPKMVKSTKDIEEVEKGDYFKVMIWSEALHKEIAMPIDQTFRFDLQFGRRVIGKLLGLDSRTQWRSCGQSKEEETADCEAFKSIFANYDFSLEA